MTSEPNLDLAKLKAVAEAATDLPWGQLDEPFWEHIVCAGGQVHICTSAKPSDAAHIATFDPPTVLALIAEVERLKGELLKANKDKERLEGRCSAIKARVKELEEMQVHDCERIGEIDKLKGQLADERVRAEAYKACVDYVGGVVAASDAKQGKWREWDRLRKAARALDHEESNDGE